MRAVGRVAVWVLVVLLVLATFSWAGIMLVAPYLFLIPAVALVVLIGFLAILVGCERRCAGRAEAAIRAHTDQSAG
jgi:hypothetical protein